MMVSKLVICMHSRQCIVERTPKAILKEHIEEGGVDAPVNEEHLEVATGWIGYMIKV